MSHGPTVIGGGRGRVVAEATMAKVSGEEQFGFCLIKPLCGRTPRPAADTVRKVEDNRDSVFRQITDLWSSGGRRGKESACAISQPHLV